MSENESTTTVEESAAVVTKTAKKRPAKKAAAKAAKEVKNAKASPKKKAAATKEKGAKGAKAKKAKAAASKNGQPRSKRIDPETYGIGTSEFRLLKGFEKTDPKRPLNTNGVRDRLGLGETSAIPRKLFKALLDSSLITTKVSVEGVDEDSRAAHYCITASGKKKIEQIEKALAKK